MSLAVSTMIISGKPFLLCKGAGFILEGIMCLLNSIHVVCDRKSETVGQILRVL